MASPFQILVVGVGALGCEILSKLALAGFDRLDIVDFDVVEGSNLCRQFLFTSHDVGRPKAAVAAERLRSRHPGLVCRAHVCRVELLPASFLVQFNLVFAALDNVKGRLWLNEILCTAAPPASLLLVEAGTEGLMGHVRAVLPGRTACLYCTRFLHPPPRTRPLCTLTGTPRTVEDCIAWAILVEWPRRQHAPPADLDQLVALSRTRAAAASLDEGDRAITRQTVQQFLDTAIPAIISTTAVVAGLAVLGAQQALSGQVDLEQETQANYWFFNGQAGLYIASQRLALDPACPVCHPANTGG